MHRVLNSQIFIEWFLESSKSILQCTKSLKGKKLLIAWRYIVVAGEYRYCNTGIHLWIPVINLYTKLNTSIWIPVFSGYQFLDIGIVFYTINTSFQIPVFIFYFWIPVFEYQYYDYHSRISGPICMKIYLVNLRKFE